MTNVTSFVCIRTYVLNVTITFFFLSCSLPAQYTTLLTLSIILPWLYISAIKKCMLNDMLTLPTLHAFSTACAASV